jgi:hypothetical protein
MFHNLIIHTHGECGPKAPQTRQAGPGPEAGNYRVFGQVVFLLEFFGFFDTVYLEILSFRLDDAPRKKQTGPPGRSIPDQ